MKLGEFRKLTEKLSDDTDIVINCYIEGEGHFVDLLTNVRIEKNKALKELSLSGFDKDGNCIYAVDSYSSKVVYIDEQPEL